MIKENYLKYHIADVYLAGCVKERSENVANIYYHAKINEPIFIGEDGDSSGILEKINSVNWCAHTDLSMGQKDTIYFYLSYSNVYGEVIYFSPIYYIQRCTYKIDYN